jgi:hypothetical protein
MALQGYMQGQQFQNQRVQAERDTQLYDMQMQQYQTAQQTLAREQARAAEVQAALANVASRIGTGEVTAEEIAQIGLQFPEISEQVNASYDLLSETQKQGQIKELSRFAIALSRSPEVAMGLIDQRIAAAEESGLTDEVGQLQAMKSMAQMDPTAPLTAVLLQLGTVMDPEQFKTFYEVAMPKTPEAASAEGKVLQDYQNGWYGQPGTPEALARANEAIANLKKAPLVQNIVGGEDTAFDKALGQGQAEQILAISAQGTVARRNRNTLFELQDLLANTPSGTEAGIKSFAGNFGINTEGLSEIQAAEALISQLVPTQRPPGSGVMSDADLELYKRSLPRIINQAGGNQKIIQTTLAINEYLIKEAEIADQVINREITPADGRQKMAALVNPLAEFGAGGGATTGRRRFDAQGREIK